MLLKINKQKVAYLACSYFLCLSFFVESKTIKFGALITSGPQRIKYATEVENFEHNNPDVEVQLIALKDHEYKKTLENWLTQETGLDLLTWQGGERLFQYVRAGYVENINELWQKNNLAAEFTKNSQKKVSYQDNFYAVPTSYYHWGIFYKKSVFQKFNIPIPKNWEAFLYACKLLKNENITPITIGTKYKWPSAAWFDYINLRLNGIEFHQQLLQGKIPFTNDKVRNVFIKWHYLLENNFFIDNHQELSWERSIPLIYNETAGMTLIGNFITEKIPPSLKDDIGFFSFPAINIEHALYEEAPLDVLMIPTNAKNKQLAKKLLLHMANAKFLAQYNDFVGMLSPNINSQQKINKFTHTGLTLLKNAPGLTQFFDRDTNKKMSDEAISIFTRFMENKNIEQALNELEKARQQHLINLN